MLPAMQKCKKIYREKCQYVHFDGKLHKECKYTGPFFHCPKHPTAHGRSG